MTAVFLVLIYSYQDFEMYTNGLRKVVKSIIALSFQSFQQL